MSTDYSSEDSKYKLTPEEISSWEENGYFVRHGVFTEEENDILTQTANDIALGKIPYPDNRIFQNALVRDGIVEASGIHAMHSVHQMNLYSQVFLDRTRDPRLTEPVVDLLGPDLLGLNSLYIWKSPKIGLGFPWHQDKWYTQKQFTTKMTVGTWTAIDAADLDNGCLHVIPGSHKIGILEHVDLEGTQQQEFKRAVGAKDEDGVAVEIPPGSVIFFNNQILHSSTDNKSDRFRRCNVAHYISSKAVRVPMKNRDNLRPLMWVRGKIYPTLSDKVYRDPIPFT